MKPHYDQALAGATVSIERAGAVPGATRNAAEARLVHLQPYRASTGEITGIIGVVIDITTRKRAEAQLRRQMEMQTLLLDVTSALIAANDVEALGGIISAKVSAVFSADVCLNYRVDPIKQRLDLVFDHGIPPDQRNSAVVIEFGQAYSGSSAMAGAVIVADRQRIDSDPRAEFLRSIGVHAFACHPLKAAGNRVLGTLCVGSTTRERFSDDEVAWLGTIANVLAQAWQRLEADQAQQGSQRQLAAVLEALPIGVALVDTDGATVLGNEVYRQFVPTIVPSPDDKRHQLWQGRDDQGRLIELEQFSAARALRGERVWPGQTFLYHGRANGSIWTRVAALPFTASTGEIIGATVVIEDIDEETRARDRIKESEERLQAASAAARFGVHDMDVARGTTRWSSELVRILGRGDTSVTVTSIDVDAVRHPDDRQPIADMMRGVLTRPGPYEYECRILRPGGSVRWLLNRGEAIGPLDPISGQVARVTGTVIDITERKGVEDALRTRTAELEALQTSAPVGLAYYDRQHRFLRINDELAYINGIAAEDHIGRTVGELLPVLAPFVDPMIDNVFRTGLSTGGIEIDGETPSHPGVPRTGLAGFFPVRDASGEVAQVGVWVVDISERKRTEVALRESEQRLSLAMASGGLAAWELDIETGREAWDDRLDLLMGVTPDRPTTQRGSWRDFIVAEDRERVEGELQAVMAGGASFDIEFRVRRDDSERWLASRGALDHHDGGSARVIGVVQDITARKAQELALAVAAERSEVAQLAARAMHYEFVPAQGSVARTPAFTELLGYGDDEAPAGPDMWRGLIHPEEQKATWSAIAAGIANKKGHGLDYRVRHRAGHYIWVHDRARVLSGNGQPDRLVGMVLDISEHKAREQHIQLLMLEVNHRAKNMLSLVQAIARQTINHTNHDTGDFIARFSQRLRALAANQDLLVRNNWQGVDLDQLIRAQLAPFTDAVGSRIRLTGPQVQLSASAAQGIGLALHELATNTTKYGALSNKTGRIDINWELHGDRFAMTWVEADGPTVQTPERRGFGSTVITRMAEISVDGSVALDYAPTGVTWSLTCDAAKVLEPHDSAGGGIGNTKPIRTAS